MPIENLNGLSNDLREIEKAFKEKIEPFRSDLWRYCYKLTGSPWDAEDLVQDTLLKSLSMLAKLYQPVEVKPYLFKIATNQWIDQMRRKKYVSHPLEEHLLPDKSFQDELQLIESLDLLMRVLTPLQYVVLILTDAFQFSGKEVAEIVGTTEGAIHTNLSRTREKLRKIRHVNVKEKADIKHLHTNQVMGVLLEGFRKKDPHLIASILDENIVTDITHAGIEIGINETKKNSLKDWEAIVQDQHVIVTEYIELWGRPVVIEMERKQDNELYLNNIHYIEITEYKVTYWKFYCFSWDLMNEAAKELNVKLNAKYFYHII
ncbi:RNA polymerase sigma factor [Heyndrickxia sporothermodurans]